MKRIIFAAVAASTLALTACGGGVVDSIEASRPTTSSPVQATETTPTETSSPAAPTTVDTDPDITPAQQIAIEALVETVPVFAGVPQAMIVEGFEATCGFLDSGYSIEYVVGTMVSVGYEAGEAGGLISASILSTCPEYTPLLDEFIAGN